jgi:F0F1-type ATP synthase membrane subunit b/b'
VRNDLRQQALDRRQALLNTARQQADGKLDEAMAELDKEATAARVDLETRARELARLFAGKLLGREVSR